MLVLEAYTGINRKDGSAEAMVYRHPVIALKTTTIQIVRHYADDDDADPEVAFSHTITQALFAGNQLLGPEDEGFFVEPPTYAALVMQALVPPTVIFLLKKDAPKPERETLCRLVSCAWSDAEDDKRLANEERFLLRDWLAKVGLGKEADKRRRRGAHNDTDASSPTYLGEDL